VGRPRAGTGGAKGQHISRADRESEEEPAHAALRGEVFGESAVWRKGEREPSYPTPQLGGDGVITREQEKTFVSEAQRGGHDGLRHGGEKMEVRGSSQGPG